jgi:glycosyltransferase involved in cell wall biosynthesis
MKHTKPRILFLIRDITTIGGTLLNALRLVSRLRQLGFPVMIMGSGDNRSIKKQLVRFNMSVGLTVYPIEPPKKKLIKNLSKYWPNIVFTLPCFFSLWKYRKHFDIIHGPLLMESGLLCALATIFLGKSSIVKIGSGGRYGDVQRAFRVGGSAIRRRLFTRITKFVCLTEEIEDELVQQLEVPPDKLIRIPNGVDSRSFRPVNREEKLKLRANMGVSSDEKVILFVGRLEFKKRVDFLLKAWEKVQTARNGQDRLLIVGDGSLRLELEKIKDEMNNRGTVIFYGESENITRIMQAADIFVLPSVSEGMANVFLESMASALPVIATDTKGNAEILKHRENALLFQEEDIQDLSDTILYLLKHDAVAAKLGENARRFVEERFNLSNIVKQYTELYHRLTQNRG